NRFGVCAGSEWEHRGRADGFDECFFHFFFRLCFEVGRSLPRPARDPGFLRREMPLLSFILQGAKEGKKTTAKKHFARKAQPCGLDARTNRGRSRTSA